MDAAYQAEAWTDLAIAVVGASAALAGLLFVAVTNNLDDIIAIPEAPGYVAQALIMLVAPVFVGGCVLVPAQSETALGVELLALAVVIGGALGWLTRPSTRPDGHERWAWLLVNVLPAIVVVLALLLAGIGLLSTTLGGLYWLAPAFAAGLLGGLSIAWTLLIEIRRPD